MRSKRVERTIYLSKLELKKCVQSIPLHLNTQNTATSKQLVAGNAKGTYRFQNGFYVLPDLRATIQKVMDTTLEGLNSTIAFPNDIKTITKRSLEHHEQEIGKTLKKLEEENIAISLHN